MVYIFNVENLLRRQHGIEPSRDQIIQGEASCISQVGSFLVSVNYNVGIQLQGDGSLKVLPNAWDVVKHGDASTFNNFLVKF